MKLKYRVLTEEQIEALKNLIILADEEISERNAYIIVALQADMPGMDALAREIHDLKNQLTAAQIKLQMFERFGHEEVKAHLEKKKDDK